MVEFYSRRPLAQIWREGGTSSSDGKGFAAGHPLGAVYHRQRVFSIPKRLRIYFLFDRKILAKLSICAWKVVKAYLKSTVSDDNAVPGVSIAVQTYGDFLNFNPHLHAIVSDGCFLDDCDFHLVYGFSDSQIPATDYQN